MKSLKTAADSYLPEFIIALVVMSVSMLIINDGRFIYIFSAFSICVVVAFLSLKFPTFPLYLLLILGHIVPIIGTFYDYYASVRPGGLQVHPTDPVYAVIFLTMVLAVIRDPGLVTANWSYLHGGVFLGLALIVWIVLGYKEHGYSALAEFRLQFITLFIPFYCLSARISVEKWVSFLRWTFWLSALVAVPLVAIAVSEGARLFSPWNRILDANTHTWLMISLFLLAVPGLVCRGFYQSLIAWIIGGGYVLLILSDGHRSVWLASAAILITICFLGNSEFRRLRIIAALLFLTVLPLIILVGFEGQTAISDFIVSRTGAFFSPSQDGTARWRLWLWGGAWKIFMENPVMGIGLGSYFDEVWIILTGKPESASLHNFYMILLLKGGVVLAVLYGWYVYSICWTFTKLRKDASPRSHTFNTLGLAILVGTLAYQIPYGPYVVLMLFIGSLLALALASHRENAQGIQT